MLEKTAEAEGLTIFRKLLESMLKEAGYEDFSLSARTEVTIGGIKLGVISVEHEVLQQMKAESLSTLGYISTGPKWTLAIVGICPRCGEETHGQHITNALSLGLAFKNPFTPCSHKCPMEA